MSQIIIGSNSGGSTGANSFPTNASTATPAGGVLNILGGTDISTTGAGNTVTINYTGPGAGSWVVVTAATQAIAANTGYIGNRATLITFTIPVLAAVGSIIRVTGLGAGGWLINLNGGQNIVAVPGTSAGTSVASTDRYDGIEMVCSVANTTFNVLSSMGNLKYT